MKGITLMRRVIFLAAIVLAVFSCTYGGNNNSGGTTDSADMNVDGTNNAMSVDTTTQYDSSANNDGTNTGNGAAGATDNNGTSGNAGRKVVAGEGTDASQGSKLKNKGSAVNTSPERTRDSLK